jgi:hypothetical protein
VLVTDDFGDDAHVLGSLHLQTVMGTAAGKAGTP